MPSIILLYIFLLRAVATSVYFNGGLGGVVVLNLTLDGGLVALVGGGIVAEFGGSGIVVVVGGLNGGAATGGGLK